MKTICCWNDLREFGIDILTGEACAYGMRVLCDVSARGAQTVRELFGLPHNTPLADNWNGGRGNANGPSVGSVMLPYDCFKQLAVFCLFADGAAAAVDREDGAVEGWYPDDPDGDNDRFQRHLDVLREMKNLTRTYSPVGGPRVGSRTTHAMTGRTD